MVEGQLFDSLFVSPDAEALPKGDLHYTETKLFAPPGATAFL